MLLTVSISGIAGLTSYRNVVRDLDYDINRAPQKGALLEQVAKLFEPLRSTTNEEALEFQRKLFRNQLAEVREQVLEFRRRMPSTGLPSLQRPVTDPLLSRV